MQLPRDGLEYAHVTFAALPEGATVEASIDRTTWVPLTMNGNEGTLLLRGPDSTATTGIEVTVPTKLWVRVQDLPEQLIRQAGHIGLY